MTSSSSSGALEAVERILNRGSEAGDVLGQVVCALHERTGAWVAVAFHSGLGPSAGGSKPDTVHRHPVEWKGQTLAELWAGPEADPILVARVAVLVSPYCLPP